MAGPAFIGSGSRPNSASAATISPGKPTVSGQNGIMVALVLSKNNATHSTATAGWTKLFQQNSGASFTASLWIAAESAAAPTFTWTGAAACAAQIYYYAAPDNVTETTIGPNSDVGTGTTSTHATATGFNTTRANSLAAYFDGAAANTGLATPAGWTENADNGDGTSATITTTGSKSISTSGTATGAISVTGANAAWVQWQIELRGQQATGFQASKMEVGAIMAPKAGFVASKMEVGAIMAPKAGFVASKMELGVVLIPGLAVTRRRSMPIVN